MSIPGGISMFALISSRMPPRPEMKVFGVDQAALDVLEAADGEEVVLLVVVERRLVAQPAEHRVRIGVDLDVVRVVVHVAPRVHEPPRHIWCQDYDIKCRGG